MTAPLPPLPDCMPTVNALDQLFRQRHNDDDVIRLLIPVMRAAQKLAVRQALERAEATAAELRAQLDAANRQFGAEVERLVRLIEAKDELLSTPSYAAANWRERAEAAETEVARADYALRRAVERAEAAEKECERLRKDAERYVAAFQHYHAANGVDDACGLCKLDLRDPVHRRA